MTEAGKVVGFFFALLVIVSALPLIFLLIRWWRRNKMDQNDLFEVKLSRSAKAALKDRKLFAFEELKKSNSAVNVMMQRASSISRDIVKPLRAGESEKPSSLSKIDDIENGEDSSELYVTNSLQTALRDEHAYFGIKPLLLPQGVIHMCATTLTLPAGLLEDFVFYACNNINPLAFIFADNENPTSMLTRYVVYCNSQVFSLAIFLLITDDYRTLIAILFSPIVLLFEFWLNRMIACPCLKRNGSGKGSKAKETFEMWGKRLLRLAGGVMSLPLLLVFISLLVLLALGLAEGTIKSPLLGLFVVDGILIPFVIKVCMTVVSFFFALHPHHVNICGVNVFKVNNWTELQFTEEDIREHEQLSAEQAKKRKEENWIKAFGAASIFHANCYLLRYIGLASDPNYRIDVCHPSCYCARCWHAIGELYWRVPDHESKHPTRKLQGEGNETSSGSQEEEEEEEQQRKTKPAGRMNQGGLMEEREVNYSGKMGDSGMCAPLIDADSLL